MVIPPDKNDHDAQKFGCHKCLLTFLLFSLRRGDRHTRAMTINH